MALDMLPRPADASAQSYPPFTSEAASHLQDRGGFWRFQKREIVEGPDAIPATRILVLGIGNVLMGDEGVGAHIIEALRKEFEFSENVRLMHDWTLGLGLLDTVIRTDCLIVVGAVRAGSVPGTLHRPKDSELSSTLMKSGSVHEIALAETLAAAEILGRKPEAVILGIEPEDTASQSAMLTETVELRMPQLMDATLREIRRMGGAYRHNDAENRPPVAREAAVV